MISFHQKGNFNNLEKFLKTSSKKNVYAILNKYGKEGVLALSLATPIDSGKTSSSWNYKIIKFSGGAKIEWINSNIINDVPIAILIQYGHATKNGGYVQGREYINTALRPIFDKIEKELWMEVSK